ncbi:MAG TPA: NAD-dependent epimerase/dehydratase family protein [Gemmatimonadales bacterium]|nr:NAD-dependent epimerase/dehydratase family protein [Gemmatimonadales bacterium]
MSRTALVAGASGLVGRHVLRLLLGDPEWERVTVFGRRDLPIAHKKLVQRIVDFDRLSDLPDFPRVHAVFCCLGTTIKRAGSEAEFRKVDYTYVVELARLALRHRASQFLVVTAVGADPRSRVFYSRVKGEVDEAVQRLHFDGVQIFHPSLLVGRRAQGRPLELLAMIVSPLVSWAMRGPLGRYRPIGAARVARALVRVAREAPRGAHVYEGDQIRRLGRR